MATAVDLFAGCGGTTLGLTNAGFEVIAAVEISEQPIKVFKSNFSQTQVFKKDLFLYTPEELLSDLDIAPGQLDLLAGCPPCQSFSSMRTRNGSIQPTDQRSRLVEVFCNFVIKMQPKAFAFENVPGLFDKNEFSLIIDQLESAGYYTDADILNARDFGVPQRRRRVVAIGSKLAKVKLVKNTKARKTVEQAIGHLETAGASNDYAHDLPERRSEKIQKLISLIPKNGGSRSSLPEEYILACHKRNPSGFKDVYGRMSWDDVSPTITGGCASPSKGRFLHPSENRCITIREASILQGFPEKYIIPQTVTKTDLALMIGNALPPPMLEHQAKTLLELMH